MPEKSVLIIDDDHALVVALKEGLENLGFKVFAAYDGLQGVLQAHQNKPAAIILDFQMPAGGGAGVYERLRASLDTCNVPILFLTGVSVDQVRSKVRATPNTYFLKKPATVSQMEVVLGKILGMAQMKPETQPAAPGSRAEPEGTAADREVRSAARGKFHEFDVRVLYADTDRLGIIYYANYFKYFELGRTELLRSLGLRYRDLEMDRKLFMPVVEARCEYLSPSRYDDLLSVRTWISSLGSASLCFQNEIYNREGGERPVARGFSRHAVVTESWKPTRLPDDLRALLQPYMAPDAGQKNA